MPFSNADTERDPSAAIDVAVRRAAADFLEMPGLRLTAAQARRLWMLEAAVCGAALEQLVRCGFLVRIGRDRFIRADAH